MAALVEEDYMMVSARELKEIRLYIAIIDSYTALIDSLAQKVQSRNAPDHTVSSLSYGVLKLLPLRQHLPVLHLLSPNTRSLRRMTTASSGRRMHRNNPRITHQRMSHQSCPEMTLTGMLIGIEILLRLLPEMKVAGTLNGIQITPMHGCFQITPGQINGYHNPAHIDHQFVTSRGRTGEVAS